MSVDSAANGIDQGARKLQGAMLEHSSLTIERMPGLGAALNRFIAEAPLLLSSLVARPCAGSIEEARATRQSQAIEDCSGLTAAVYATAEPAARILIALDERIDDLIVSSIFGEVVAEVSTDPASESRKPRTKSTNYPPVGRSASKATFFSCTPVRCLVQEGHDT